MRPHKLSTFLTVGFVLALGACSDDDDTKLIIDGGNNPTGSATSVTTPDAGAAVTQPSDCFNNPTTYLEIINACTDAEKVTKNPTLPLLMADGGLPPIP